jgi:hypothetical protein
MNRRTFLRQAIVATAALPLAPVLASEKELNWTDWACENMSADEVKGYRAFMGLHDRMEDRAATSFSQIESLHFATPRAWTNLARNLPL